jgi:hypothetical protein
MAARVRATPHPGTSPTIRTRGISHLWALLLSVVELHKGCGLDNLPELCKSFRLCRIFRLLAIGSVALEQGFLSTTIKRSMCVRPRSRARQVGGSDEVCICIDFPVRPCPLGQGPGHAKTRENEQKCACNRRDEKKMEIASSLGWVFFAEWHPASSSSADSGHASGLVS